MTERQRRLLVYRLPALVWACCVLGFSGGSFSASQTGSILETIVIWLFHHPLPQSQFDTLHTLVRKAAHITEYGILGLLLFRAAREGRKGWSAQWALTAVAIAIAVATVDEVHQSFVPSRTGSPVDVAIDATGAGLAQVVLWTFSRRKTGIDGSRFS